LEGWIKNFNGRPFFSLFFVARANQKIRILALGGDHPQKMCSAISLARHLVTVASSHHRIDVTGIRLLPHHPQIPQLHTTTNFGRTDLKIGASESSHRALHSHPNEIPRFFFSTCLKVRCSDSGPAGARESGKNREQDSSC
jgi:hypothetical protein